MTIDVAFRVRLPDGEWLGERELPGRAGELAEAESIDGAVVISVEDAPETIVTDDIGALAQNLCIDAVADLAADRNVAMHHYDKPGYVRLDPEGWWVRVSGDYVEEVVLPRLELLDGLLGCGKRIAAFLRSLGTRDAQADDLDARAKQALAAVAAAPREWPGLPPDEGPGPPR